MTAKLNRLAETNVSARMPKSLRRRDLQTEDLSKLAGVVVEMQVNFFGHGL